MHHVTKNPSWAFCSKLRGFSSEMSQRQLLSRNSFARLDQVLTHVCLFVMLSCCFFCALKPARSLHIGLSVLNSLHTAPMVSLESKPAWEARARAIGVPDGFIDELQQANLDTLGQWAFCCAGDPSSSDDSPIKEAVRVLIGRDVTPQEMVLCRRLYFEGRTYAVSDMQSRIDRSAEDKQT